MTESAELARLVASQLGGDLDRILGSLPGSDAPDETPDAASPDEREIAQEAHEVLELCQIAGIGSGQRVLLKPGTYDIGPFTSPPGMPGSSDHRMTPFRLQVSPDNSLVMKTLGRPVSVDGRQIDDGLRMRGGFIDAGAARFSLAPPRKPGSNPAPSSDQIVQALPPKKIPVAEIRGASIEHKSRKRNKRDKDPHDFPELTRAVLESRARSVRKQRMLNPDACELISRARAGKPHVWNIDRSDSQFGVATVAYGDTPWTPPYDRPDKVRDDAAYAVHEFLELPSVPISLDLQRHGLGIIGPRAAVLAAARHMIVSMAILTSAADLELAVMAGHDHAGEWAWTGHLPHTRPQESQAMPLLLIDGLHQIGANELRALLAESNNLAAIVLEPELGDLPSICGTVMEIRTDGTAAIMDFRRGKTINRRATPVGMTELIAAEAATAIERAHSGSDFGSANKSPDRSPLPEIAIPDHVKRPDSPAALPQRRR